MEVIIEGRSINPCPHFTHTRGAPWSVRRIEVAPSHQYSAGFRRLPHSYSDTTFDYGSIGRGVKSLRPQHVISQDIVNG